MARNQIIIRPATTPYRRQRQQVSSGRVAEVAGGTAAECTAVWCCGPCTVVNLIILAVYKVPAGLCRKAIRRRRRRRMMKKGLLPAATASERERMEWNEAAGAGVWKDEDDVMVVVVGRGGEREVEMETEMDKELMELEKEMWDRFYSTGFWRSDSQREH